jgi:sulfatase maturation enzyme AslB (radical SAM superfamily)
MKSIEIKSIGFALSPNNIPSFLLDWELTKRCNLNCSYCGIGMDGGHDNTLPHPPLDECLQSIDFMYDYVSLYMQHKKPSQRKVVLNIYGGEALFHPDIIEILEQCRKKYKKYSNQWQLTITTTTNAIVNKNIWNNIIPLIDEFNVSYHAENLDKHEQLFFDNLLELKKQNKRVKCIIMMHPDVWQKSLHAQKFCKEQTINYVAKLLDEGHDNDVRYSSDQFKYMKEYWMSQTTPTTVVETDLLLNKIDATKEIAGLCEGRACCGGRKLALNNSLKSSVTFVPKQGFKDWYCSVNWFFLFVRQADGSVYTNKDCKTSLNSKVEPIGNLLDYNKILSDLKKLLATKSMPVIKCVKQICMCGYCAPKAENLNEFKDLISRNVITDVINYE